MERERTKVEYRNSIRSKVLIRKAFSDLLKEKPYSEIKASDIIEKADIARATFYAHFSDTDDLLLALSASLVDEIATMLTPLSKNNLNIELKKNLDIIMRCIERDFGYVELLSKALCSSPVLSTVLDNLSDRLSYLKDRATLSFLLSGAFYYLRSILTKEASPSLKEASEVLEKYMLSLLEATVAE